MVKKSKSGKEAKLNGSNYKVFFDFDNTITTIDILDDIIQRFSINDGWVKLEEDWKAGKIGSKECLEGQLKFTRVAKQDFIKYLKTIKIDPHFRVLIANLKKRNIAFAITSDSFSFVIKSVLENNGIKGIKIYSNRLRFYKDRLIPLFPYFDKNCPRCANCKKSHLLNGGKKDKMIVYIGDGRSDICPAEHADVVFAKASLLKHFRDRKMECVEFKDLGDVDKTLNM